MVKMLSVLCACGTQVSKQAHKPTQRQRFHTKVCTLYCKGTDTVQSSAAITKE